MTTRKLSRHTTPRRRTDERRYRTDPMVHHLKARASQSSRRDLSALSATHSEHVFIYKKSFALNSPCPYAFLSGGPKLDIEALSSVVEETG